MPGPWGNWRTSTAYRQRQRRPHPAPQYRKNRHHQRRGGQFFRARGYEIDKGAFFDQDSILRQTQDAVIDPNTLNAFFTAGENPIGQIILIGTVPVRVIGVTVALPWHPDTLNVTVCLTPR